MPGAFAWHVMTAGSNAAVIPPGTVLPDRGCRQRATHRYWVISPLSGEAAL